MGVSISAIIKNDLPSSATHEMKMDYIDATIGRLNSHFHTDEAINKFINASSEWPENWEYSIETMNGFGRMILMDGFWEVEPGFDYFQYFEKIAGRFWLRDSLFDLAHALGTTEIWVCEENLTTNGCPDFDDISFIDWLVWATSQKGVIKDFNPNITYRSEDGHFRYDSIYKETFIGLMEDLQSIIRDVQLTLGQNVQVCRLSSAGQFHISVHFPDGNNLFNIETKKLLVADNFLSYTYENAGFVVLYYPSMVKVVSYSGKELMAGQTDDFDFRNLISSDILKYKAGTPEYYHTHVLQNKITGEIIYFIEDINYNDVSKICTRMVRYISRDNCLVESFSEEYEVA